MPTGTSAMPQAIDVFRNPAGGDPLDGTGDPTVKHHTVEDLQNDAILALERQLVGPFVVNVCSDQYAGGAKGDGVTNDQPAFAAAAAAVQAGGIIVIPPPPGGANYILNSEWDILRPVTVFGPSAGNFTQPHMKFTSAAGIMLGTADVAEFSLFFSVFVEGSNVAGGDGFWCRSSSPRLVNCAAYLFGRYGFNMDSGAGADRANNFLLQGCYAVQNGSHGFYYSGGNSNAGHTDDCRAKSNGGYGFYENSTANNKWTVPLTSGNTGGDYRTNGSSHTWDTVYAEAGGSFLFDVGANHQTFTTGAYAVPTITDSSSGTNRKFRNGAWDQLYVGTSDNSTSTAAFIVDGNSKVQIGVSSTKIVKHLHFNPAAVAFGTIAANSTVDVAVTCTGVTTADTVIGNPTAGLSAGTNAGLPYVSAADTVTQRMANVTVNPIVTTNRNWYIDAWRH